MTGWRINFNTYGRVFKSLFMIHNETVNVWSHLLASIFFVFMIGYLYTAMPPQSNIENLTLSQKWSGQSYSIAKINSLCYLVEGKDCQEMKAEFILSEMLKPQVSSLKNF